MADIPVTFTTGTLANPACYSTEQARFVAYIAALGGTVPAGYTQWIVSNSTPGSNDRSKIWLYVDSQGYPVDALLWSAVSATWVRWLDLNKYPATSVGAGNAYQITFNPAKEAYKTGEVIIFKALFANTAAATLQIDGLAVVSLKKHNDQALAANDIEAGQIVFAVYDGTNFQVISSTASTAIALADIPPGADTQYLRTRLVAGVLTVEWENPDQSSNLYAAMYGSWTLAQVVFGDPLPVTGFVDYGESYGITSDKALGKYTILKTGVYEVTFTGLLTGAALNAAVEMGVALNGATTVMAGSGCIGNYVLAPVATFFSKVCYVPLTISDEITLLLLNLDNGAANTAVSDLNFTLRFLK